MVKLAQASSSRSKISWVDEVEEVEIWENKGSIWDNFDIAKITNVGFKLEFVSPDKHGESSIYEIEDEDIAS